MALTTCRECGKQVSTEAESCPHCGVVKPFRPQKYGRAVNPQRKYPGPKIVTGVIAAVCAVVWAGRSDDEQSNKASTETANPACRSDWRLCSSNKEMVTDYSGWIRSQFACRDALGSYVRYGKPELGWFSFGSYIIGNDYARSARVTLIEPDAQVSNAFNAKLHVKVRCEYDLRSEKVLDVSTTENR